jgi:hypothetical protein
VFVDVSQLRESVREILLTASEEANQRWAPDGTPLYVASEVEADGVAHPVAKVIGRHMPAGLGGPGNPDLADAVAAVITLARYGLRQIRLRNEIRRQLKAGAAPEPDAV